MQHQKAKWDNLRHRNGALDLIHGGDALLALLPGNVEGWRVETLAPTGGPHGSMHRLKSHIPLRAEPGGDLAHLLPVIVVEVPAHGEDLDSRRAARSQLIQDSRMEALAQMDVCRYGSQHRSALPPLPASESKPIQANLSPGSGQSGPDSIPPTRPNGRRSSRRLRRARR